MLDSRILPGWPDLSPGVFWQRNPTPKPLDFMSGENPRPENELPPPARSGALPWLVGAFALWQLVSPPLANVMEFVPVRPTAYDVDPPIETTQRWGRFTDVEPVQAAAEALGTALSGWGELTGQEQGWNMFTPAFPPYTVVMVAEFHFPDGTADRVASRFNPDPPRPRFPLVYDREFNYEANVFMLAWHCHPESRAEGSDVCRQLPEKVRENDHLITRWLSWQAKRYATAHPGKPLPTEVVLVLRYIPTSLPDGSGGGRPTFERPFARWLPAGPTEAGYMPLEGYDPVAGWFVPLREWGPP